ncbi:MAG: DNA mismatch repair protein MutS, partial [Caulobacteraceae bacterium]|nr:DNA mismatch repair protein MutS [Caulobacteraceae bacterium]
GAAIAGLLAAAGTQLDPLPAELAGCAASLRLDGDLAAFAGALRAGLAEAPPTLARDGGFVAQGVSAPLDEARELRDGGRRVIAGLEQRLAGEAGVPLKVRHNAVLGYFVEVSAKAGEALLRPPLQASFIHRQTLAGQLRFTTLELADLDARIARAADQALALELEAFEAWRAQAQALGAPILAAAEALAAIDVAAALAEWAEETGAVRPTVDASRAFAATAARHPVVEAAVRRAGGAYTPNDCALDGEGVAGPRLAIVTGPNMAGKSTFLRQAALLAILAQAGSFVPARSLKMGVVDRLFSRVGAGDDLARGRSTFMTEMIETAAILNQATDRSLVILDEIGRGTATWDGLAIAWATAEALHDTNRCRALFATHFHELAELETRLAHVANLSMRAKEWNGDLVFLHEAGPGCADRSYGVHVARLAGVPAPVVARAREVLSRLEGAATSRHRLEDLPLFALAEPAAPPPGPTRLEAAVAALDPDSLTPREALEALYGLKGIGW